MGILSAILPGIREFRTPFIVGSLWVSAIVLISWDRYDGDLQQVVLFRNVHDIANNLPETIQLGVATFFLYIVGLFAKGIQEWLTDIPALRRLSSRLLEYSPFVRVGTRGRDYLVDAARERFAAYPSDVRTVAYRILNEEYDLADVILATRSPEQFQEYDRWRTEAEFRNGIWVPLLFVGFGLGGLASGALAWVLYGGFAFASAVLKLQGVDRRLKAEQRLASAVYFNLASTPLFDALLSELDRREAERASWTNGKALRDTERTAWAIDFFAARNIERFIVQLLNRTTDTTQLRATLDATSKRGFDYIVESRELRHFAVVSYAGNDLQTRVDTSRAISAYKRLHRTLNDIAASEELTHEQVTLDGVIASIGDHLASSLKHDASPDDWEVAVRMIDWRNVAFAEFPPGVRMRLANA